MIPAEYRDSGIESYWDPEHGWTEIWHAWSEDEFALDATRVTLAVGNCGVDGDTFKNSVLMDKYGIQINKTSRNTVLFMTNIGTTRSSVAYLIEALLKIAQEIENELEDASAMTPQVVRQARARADRGAAAAAGLLPLPRALPQPRRQGHPRRATCAPPTSWPTTRASASTSPSATAPWSRPSTRAASWCRPRSSFPTHPDFRSWFPARWCPRKSSSSCARWT